MTGKRLDDLSMDVDSAYLALHEAIRGQGWRQHFILVAFLAVYLVDLRIGDVGVTWNQITRVELNLEEIDGRLETKASFFWVMTNPMELPAGSGAAISYEEVKP